jgi:hypothetical protein
MDKDRKPNKFREHLERSSRIVSQWPAWKQEILGGKARPPETEKRVAAHARAMANRGIKILSTYDMTIRFGGSDRDSDKALSMEVPGGLILAERRQIWDPNAHNLPYWELTFAEIEC